MHFCRIQQLQSTLEDRINPPLVCGRVSPRLRVPDHIPKPQYLESSKVPMISSELQIPDSNGIVKMKKACKLAARVLDYAGTLVRVSIKISFCSCGSLNLIESLSVVAAVCYYR